MSANTFKITFNRIIAFILFGTLGVSATLYALYHLSQAATHPEMADPSYTKMLITIAIGLAVLLIITIWQIFSLFYRIRKHKSGARLSLSFALRMLITTIIPVGIIGAFAWQFLSYDLGKTFNSQVSDALEDSLQLARTSITLRARQALNQTQSLADTMTDMNYADLISDIERLRRRSGANELAVFDHQGNLVAFANNNLNVMNVTPPSPAALLRTREGQDYFEYETDDNRYTIKVLADIDKHNREPYYLQANYPMPDAFNSLANSVRESYRQYQSYRFLQPHITTSLLFVLSFILALTILTALWISALFGESMTRPVRQLIDATKKVTEGDFSTPVTDLPENDLGTLGDNFNAMLLTLRDAESMNNHIQNQLTEQNTFLATILENITAGVLTLDWHGKLQTLNQAAILILDTSMNRHLGRRPPQNQKTPEDSYEELMQALSSHIQKTKWRCEVTLSQFGQRKILICHGSRLPRQNHKNRGGQVIVFEDVTEFQQNQRNSAWEEVARRLAHEIKNPLTPIRLQGERLQRKLSDKLSEESDQHILQRATTTIINQVDAMQQMVSDFSQYAKPLELRQKAIDFNHLLKDIAELYPDIELTLQLKEPLPEMCADPIQLRQVIHNLTKNAIEATPDNETTHILWQTESNGKTITFTIEDNGSGFADLKQDPFEPYVTNKTKGTGLGLAIVKKIITEHQGSIQAGHSKTLKGAAIIITLPIQTK
ncbi:HAMP domain-containing histidine kinase [Suttonella ornithocola]|uniref:histidine kinase n=1 Tax=Suttonella ornithocola TaxID=279832 RepID=A0A380MQH9_9GAMM|nr:HAMP domain-containing histidine kinase [Suttonella ornithocola]SUO94562.1 Alginate biosynthesis sensor protein kinB [Suttonella ornithocola]